MKLKNRDFVRYVAHLYNEFVPYNTLIIPGWAELSPEAIANQTYAIVENIYNLKKMLIGEDAVKAEERETLLTVVDNYWTYHIDLMDQMRQGIGLQASAQKDPVKEYTVEAGRMYDEMNMNIRRDTLKYLFGFAREALGQKEIDMDNIQTVQQGEEYEQVVEPDEAQIERRDTLKYLFGFAREALGQKEIDMDNIQTVQQGEEYEQVVEPDEAQIEALAEYLNSLSDEEYAKGQKEIDMDNIQTVQQGEEYEQVVEPDEAQIEALAEYLNSLSDEEYAKVLEELGIDAEQDESGEWKIKE